MSLSTAHDQTHVKESASTTGDPIEWWYINAQITAPDSPIDGWTMTAIFLRFGEVIEEGRFLLVPPTPRSSPLDFGTGRLPTGTLKASPDAMDVRIGSNFPRGGYPAYELGISGATSGDTRCAAQLSYKAELEPEKLTHLGGQLNHLTCYRVHGQGTITVDDQAYAVTAVGFYERVYGSFGWEPGETDKAHVDGWNWYWSPELGDSGPALELWSFFTAGAEQPAPYVSISDGLDWLRFNTGTRTVLEEREIEGIPYPHKIRVTDRTDDGELDLVITRRDVDARTLTPPAAKRMYFVTGYSDFEGVARVGGREIPLNGTGFGSTYEANSDW